MKGKRKEKKEKVKRRGLHCKVVLELFSFGQAKSRVILRKFRIARSNKGHNDDESRLM
jgi:hypothetical protein